MLHENHNLYIKKRKSCLYINLASEFSEWDRIVKRWAAVQPGPWDWLWLALVPVTKWNITVKQRLLFSGSLVSNKVHERHGKRSFAAGLSIDVANPPLLILFSIHNDHIPLRESQLIRVVSHAVVERFDSLGL